MNELVTRLFNAESIAGIEKVLKAIAVFVGSSTVLGVLDGLGTNLTAALSVIQTLLQSFVDETVSLAYLVGAGRDLISKSTAQTGDKA